MSLTFDCQLCNVLLFAIFGVGVYKITITSLSFIALIFDAFILPPVNFSKYGAKKGYWAVVTGASDGIGKEFSTQLAKKGFNIVLISRTQSKLEKLANELESNYKNSCKIIAFDASIDNDENYKLIEKSIKDLPISILVNNVGQSHSIPVPFLETQDKEMLDIITINNIVTLKITKLITPYIIKTTSSNDKKMKGLILTMGSFAGLFPSPLLATYSGSKFFLQGWSNALSGELKSKNIDVELVISYLVTSSMSKIKRSSLMIPNPKNFVKSTLKNVGRRVGSQERYATITPYPTHALMHWVIENSVGLFSKVVNGINLKMHQDIRFRALRKAKKLAEKKE
ncbi:hypothetical protein CANARDRAFT_203854 [[Candida] arabinofermentans NRRL YB-2248]|uniref:Very-long-chain 3-oxoacyl-CoA reductase n=1 Tax=[Candida] arabinofermentans NRRL YB-2248 TaxID=983967 RepID=A0A1E4SUB7_9ASCO|nr:hypothetical protein CANARDRAFT_203854 [[Candida] arabinofermentans NRRL YB-2248]